MDAAPHGRSRARLVPRSRWGGVVAVLAWAVLLVMGWFLRDSRDPTRFDADVHSWLFAHTGTGFSQVTLALSEPALSIGLCAVVVIGAALVGRWDLAVLGVVGPAAGLVLESHVLKPGFDRLYGAVEVASGGAVKAGYAYPSGHQTGLVCALMLLLIPLLASGAAAKAKLAAGLLVAVWSAFAAVGLVRNDYHYATDTLGGTCLGVGVMLTIALGLDLVGPRLSSPAARGRTRTARAA